MKWIRKTSILAVFVCTLVVSLVATMQPVASLAEDVPKPQIAAIESIVAAGEGSATALVIKLTGLPTYTSYKTTAPLRLVVDFSQATQGAVTAPLIINKGNFRTITASRFDTDAGILTRVDIELASDAEAVVVASPTDPNEIRISFPTLAEIETPAVATAVAVPVPVPTDMSAAAPASEPLAASKTETVPAAVSAAAVEPAPLPAVSTLTGISANGNQILLALESGVSDYKTFRLDKPDRFVIDLIGVKKVFSSRLVPLNAAGVASARIGIYPDKVRVVLDAVNGVFPAATASKTDAGVVVTLGVDAAVAPVDTTVKKTVAVTEEKPVPVPEKKAVIKDVKVAKTVKPQAEPASGAVKPEPPAVEEVRQPVAVKSNLSTGPAAVEMIDFQIVDGISRVSVKVRGEVHIDPPVLSSGFVTMTIKNATLPKNLQRSLETRSFVSPVLRVTPMVVKNKKKYDARIRIAMRARASFEYRQEGDMLYVDFKNPEGMTAETLAIETADVRPKAVKAKVAVSRNKGDDIDTELAPAANAPVKAAGAGTSKNYAGRRVTLEFADAEVRKIFQLLSEVSNKNFVLGDDVTGAISLKLVNVPWDQALDIILDTKGLDKREDGNIILIKGRGKFKSQAEEELEIKKTAAKSIELKTETFSVNYASIGDVTGQFDKLKTPERGSISSDARTNKVIVKDTPQALDDMRKLLAQLDVPERQVMIEARIIEATSTFTRNLGVNWGIHFKDGSASILGINSFDTGFGGLTSSPPTSGTGSSAGGSMGISFGTLASNIQLDMRLNAAASAGMIKIISSPKVATLNHKAAKISQGQSIPYQNTTSTAGATTQFVDATLSLDVTPHINANGTVVMQIKATNSSPGSGSPPPINKKEATTEMLLKDGETTVIGGIYVDSDTQADDGVPYLMDIPFLGKLFRSTNNSKVKTELLIFITPRILGSV